MTTAPHSRQAKASDGKSDIAQEYIESSRKRTRIITSILFACLLIIAGLYSSWFLLISFAMLPSVMIRQIEKKERGALITSVTGLNVVGLTIALQHSYRKYGISPEPGMLFSDWINWVLPFGMAWLGILIFVSLPIVMAIILETMLQNKEQHLRKQQKLLLKTWGSQIKHSPDGRRSYARADNKPRK